MPDFFGDSTAILLKNIAKIRADVARGQKRGLLAAGAVVLNASNTTVPHELGDFERTGRVTVDDDATAAAVSYKDTHYSGEAARLHEDFSMNHDAGRSAKFLEKAFAKTRPQVLKILGDNIKSEMGT